MTTRSRSQRRFLIPVVVAFLLVATTQVTSAFFGRPDEPAATAKVSDLPAAPLSEVGPAPDAAMLQKKVDAALKGSPGRVEVSVVDAVTGEQVAHVGDGEALIPASSLKVLTGTAAVASIGLEQTWVTRSVLEQRDGEAPVVWLVAGGDVMLAPGAGDPKAANGRAGLKTLAEQTAKELKASGALEAAGGALRVGVDTRMFSGDQLHPDWSDDLVSSHNVTDITPIAVFAGRTDATHTSPVVRHPDAAALKTFAGQLKDALGSDVTLVDNDAEPGFREVDPFNTGTVEGQLAAVHSATVREQLAYAEAHSDNVILEVYGRLVGIKLGRDGTEEGAVEGVTRVLHRLGLNTRGLNVRDASGLSPENRVPARTLAETMALTLNAGDQAGTSTADVKKKAQRIRRDLTFIPTMLPRAGATGTLQHRLGGDKTKALVLGKTGTLIDVISLTGVVTTKEGRPLGFSILFNDVEGNLDSARASADAVATALADCGCQ
ncbi:D-alanyl-D-alanine carboxypeptidase/D-alanyl-D-alanine-endopeptidase [Pseudoglutamicibacter cumminsii]|uniref:D-alanyl-D-alanine carboxypeptidase/D-alanyl-D-alanine-endopeptidase n=1 Tax=Pseudoglutamicibacter cumminsii TaxID=156979 RepID=UPI0021A829BC|nr:D-alanyl-D-alanine carboxypeptidase [Pseudoglutamicibacter cumminsii]MCT1685370.1 D-alanyl-D-alanine carboxypeptidase [Pseudoglutamicibacter cumminsii]